MKNLIKKITNSHYFYLIKNIIFLNNDKYFIVSFIAYYLIISSIPMVTIINYFFPLINLEFNTINLTFSTIIFLYIASKGIENYFIFSQRKYNLKIKSFSFIFSKLYSISITILLCFLLSCLLSLNYYLSSFNSFIINFYKWLINIIILFIILLIFNYLVLQRKIAIYYLILGSFISSFLLNLTSFIYGIYILNLNDREQYFGSLNNIISYLFLMYLISYFICIGNEINFYTYKKWSNNSIN